MGAPRKSPDLVRKLETYPYTILPVQCPDKETANSCSPKVVAEFFRIEALLRSKIVHQLYTHRKMDGQVHSDELSEKYSVAVGWKALEGGHHCAFKPDEILAVALAYDLVRVRMMFDSIDFVGQGIVDLTRMAESDPGSAAYYMNITLDRLKNGLRAVVLAIDPARPPEATIKDLRPYLKQLHEPYEGKRHLDDNFLFKKRPKATARTGRTLPIVKTLSKNALFKIAKGPVRIPRARIGIGHIKCDSPHDFHPYKQLPFAGYESIRTWLNYFRCYDLRTTEPGSFGVVALQVYGENSPKTYERAEQAVKRVRQLITYAERNVWPPPPIR